VAALHRPIAETCRVSPSRRRYEPVNGRETERRGSFDTVVPPLPRGAGRMSGLRLQRGPRAAMTRPSPITPGSCGLTTPSPPAEQTTISKPAAIARIMVGGPLFYCHVPGLPDGRENDRLGAGAYRRSHRCLRHGISAVGPKIPSTEAVKTARAGPFTSRQTSSHLISWMFRRSSAAVATSREDHRSPRSGQEEKFIPPAIEGSVASLRLDDVARK
jgi:hypothetical protein